MSNRGTGGLRSEINVTPLVDVVLVLLILFMVIVPSTMRGYEVEIPGTVPEAQPASAARAQIVLSVDAGSCPGLASPGAVLLPEGCRVRLHDTLVALEDLERQAAGLFATRTRENRVLFLAADDRLNYEGVMRILDTAKAGVAGLRIGIVRSPVTDS